MTQRMQLHSVGTFPVCPDCGDELRHIRDDRAQGGGHFLSCCCGDSPKLPTFDALLGAMETWCAARGVAVPRTAAVQELQQREPRLVRA